MAKFVAELPTDIIKKFEATADQTEEIMGEMTRAAAEVVLHNIENTAPEVLKGHTKVSKTYRTPSDGGINTKVYITGYIPFSNPARQYFSRRGGNGTMYHTDKGVPADFLAKLYEYGRSTSPFPKHPYLRKALKKDQIEEAMTTVRVRRYKDLWGYEDYVNNWITSGYGGKG
jgi:hypothetical protein